jgi:hypothetical protein
MLRGERLWDYVTPAGEPRGVCALCKAEAEAARWLPAELAAAGVGAGDARRSRARVLRERLARVAESARTRSDEVGETADEGARPPRRRRILVERHEPTSRNGGEGAHQPERARTRAEAEHSRPAAPAPADSQRVARHAIDRFNASEARRTIAGLMRSLGEPHASIQLEDAGGPTTVTVAWELSWYQWAIDPGEHGEVREVGKGKEIEELSEDARRWNGRVAEDGAVRLASA